MLSDFNLRVLIDALVMIDVRNGLLLVASEANQTRTNVAKVLARLFDADRESLFTFTYPDTRIVVLEKT